MGKHQKYSEEKLLDGVVKYSEIEAGKIMPVKLERWCSENVEGLEGVRDYHFIRPIREKNKETGKLIERKKICAIKIGEINSKRSMQACIKDNVLLRSSDIDDFFSLALPAQRKLIVEARKYVDELLSRNIFLSRENKALKEENKLLNDENARYAKLEKDVNTLLNLHLKFKKEMDEATYVKMLSEMGIRDGIIDLDMNQNSLQKTEDEVMILRKVVLRDAAERDERASIIESGVFSIEEILEGVKR